MVAVAGACSETGDESPGAAATFGSGGAGGSSSGKTTGEAGANGSGGTAGNSSGSGGSGGSGGEACQPVAGWMLDEARRCLGEQQVLGCAFSCGQAPSVQRDAAGQCWFVMATCDLDGFAHDASCGSAEPDMPRFCFGGGEGTGGAAGDGGQAGAAGSD
jgi:hypothetical protein